ncbi:MAG: hypothetical protein ACRYE7_01520 [Janthinobacterium lividum]
MHNNEFDRDDGNASDGRDRNDVGCDHNDDDDDDDDDDVMLCVWCGGRRMSCFCPILRMIRSGFKNSVYKSHCPNVLLK